MTGTYYHLKPILLLAGIAALSAVLGACAMFQHARNVVMHQKTFTSKKYGFTITYPADLKMTHGFNRNYLSNGEWKTYAGPHTAKGHAVLDLTLPGSNDVTDGELRIGVSRQTKALLHCTNPPGTIKKGSLGKITISGVTFTTFEAGDAAMSHYLHTRSYRMVHDGTCYAIDVLVYSTNPDVYSPPAKPPFSKKEAFKRLVPVVQNFRFLKQSKAEAAAPPPKLPATYKGTLPCADCPGIDYQLNLLADHYYVENMDYQDRDASYQESGHWSLSDDGSTLKLSSQKGKTQTWKLQENGAQLHWVTPDSGPANRQLNYNLQRSGHFHELEQAQQ
jgi:hypothetical protein